MIIENKDHLFDFDTLKSASIRLETKVIFDEEDWFVVELFPYGERKQLNLVINRKLSEEQKKDIINRVQFYAAALGYDRIILE